MICFVVLFSRITMTIVFLLSLHRGFPFLAIVTFFLRLSNHYVGNVLANDTCMLGLLVLMLGCNPTDVNVDTENNL